MEPLKNQHDDWSVADEWRNLEGLLYDDLLAFLTQKLPEDCTLHRLKAVAGTVHQAISDEWQFSISKLPQAPG